MKHNTTIVDLIGKDVICPTVHSNGSSSVTLANGIELQMIALLNAITTMEDHWPNARDYYPQGDGAFARATKEHTERIRLLQNSVLELQAMLDDVYSQQ